MKLISSIVFRYWRNCQREYRERENLVRRLNTYAFIVHLNQKANYNSFFDGL